MMSDTDWQREYLEMIKASVERLELKFDERYPLCDKRFRTLEQSKTKQAGFIAGVTICVVALFKGFTVVARMFQ